MAIDYKDNQSPLYIFQYEKIIQIVQLLFQVHFAIISL